MFRRQIPRWCAVPPRSTTTANPTLPDSAAVVIMGGGIIGCSIAYHLAKMGQKDVILLEQDQLTSGSTWHAAGLMRTYGVMSTSMAEIRRYTKQLFSKDLEAETGQTTGFLPCGVVQVASDKDFLEEERRVTALAHYSGVDVREINPQQVQELFPLCEVRDVLAGFYVPTDGRVNPADATMALAKGARMHGAKLFEQVGVDKVVKKNGRVSAVRTESGHEIQCEKVVNCAGMWARQLGAKNGITIPNAAAEHYYLLTDPMPGVNKSLPVLKDPKCHAYYREEGGGMMVGLFEPIAAGWNVKKIPPGSNFVTIGADWDRIAPYLETAMGRIPATKEAGIRQLFCGPESFTPDLSPIAGESPELKNYFVCAGLNSGGIQNSGGMGRLMAQWVKNGYPEIDVTSMNITRTNPFQTTPTYLATRVVESLGVAYYCHYPNFVRQTARNLRLSPLHERMKAQGAFMRDGSGWEYAEFFSPKKGETPDPGPLTWGKPSWFPEWGREHKAVREGVAILDMSFFAKMLVEGPGAGEALNYISANNVDGESNTIYYTLWLNEQGGIEADVTVVKLDDEKFWVLASPRLERHVQKHFAKHAPPTVRMTNISASYAQLNIQGPLSRELMQRVAPTADLSNEGFPFRHAQEIDIGLAKVLCVRITFLGELGYELYIPSEQAVGVYDLIMEQSAGRGEEGTTISTPRETGGEVGTKKDLGLVHAGMKTVHSCRFEKGYRDFGHDLDNMDSPWDAGLGFTLDMKKPGGFVGKPCALQHKEKNLTFKTRIVHVLCKDPEVSMYHGEPLFRDGVSVGYVLAASYGHTVGGAVGLAKLKSHLGGVEKINKDFVSTGKWEVNVAGTKYPAELSLKPFYDPASARVKM